MESNHHMSKQNEEMSSHITLESTDLFNKHSPKRRRRKRRRKKHLVLGVFKVSELYYRIENT